MAKKTVLLTPTPAGDDGMEVTSVTGKNISLGQKKLFAQVELHQNERAVNKHYTLIE